MHRVLVLGMLCAGAHGVFGMEKKREREEVSQEDTGAKKAHTDESEQLRMLVFESLEDAGEDIQSLLRRIRNTLEKI